MAEISVKRGRGRPRKEPETNAPMEAESIQDPSMIEFSEIPDAPDLETDIESLPPSTSSARVIIPPPPQFKFDTDAPKGRRPDDFFAYWNGLEDGYKKWVMCYVYRNWPVIQIMVPDKRRGGLRPTQQIEKVPGEDVIHNMDEFVQRYGSGDYTLRLNRQRPSESIALCLIKGVRDLEFHPPCYPPDLMDVLVMDDPANRDYINYLRLKGVWKDKELEEHEMAGAEAMTILADTVKDLSAQAAASNKEPTQTQTPAEVATKTIEMADKAFQSGISLAKEVTASQVKAAEEKATAAQAQVNPSGSLGVLKEVVGIIKDLQPPVATNVSQGTGTTDAVQKVVDTFMARISTLEGQITKLNSDRIEGLEKMMTNFRESMATATLKEKEDLVTSLEKLAKLKDTFQGLFGGAEEPEREQKIPMWLKAVEVAVPGLSSLATSLLAMSYNMAVAKTGTGTPLAPAIPGAENPSLPPASDAVKTTTGEPPMGNAIAGFLTQIERPLINHLNDPSKTGADFADWVSGGYGDIGYQAAKALGKDTLLALLGSRAAIAAVIEQIPERVSQFIDEFLMADEMGDEGDEPPEAPRVFVAPPEGAAQVVDVPPIVQAQEPARSRRKTG